MPSQFDQVMKRFDEVTAVLSEVVLLLRQVDDRFSNQFGHDLFGEDPINEEEFRTAYEHAQALPGERGRPEILTEAYEGEIHPQGNAEVLRPKMPGVTRRLVEVKGADGKVKTVSRDDLDPRVIRILDASIKAGTFWFLYERESDGQIMITAEEQIINQVGRGEVPPSANEPDLTE